MQSHPASHQRERRLDHRRASRPASGGRSLQEINMFFRLIYQSFRLQRRRKLMAALAIMLGVAVSTATIAIATDIGDKVSEELRSYGANISVVPQEDTLDLNVGGVNIKPASEGAFLNEADLPKIKGIFWRNNIRGFAPFLSTQVTLGKGATARDVELIGTRSEEHTSELQSHVNLVCR